MYSQSSIAYKVKIEVLGVVMASLEAGTSCAKLDVAFFGWVWLIVERGNILRVRKLLHVKSSSPEVKTSV